ncbi:alpha/beta hydrolase [Rhodohalobacter sp. 614A]|uniref:alpha/beta hydrolase n=1 Tax=Rhodohalobacter sp. 614A TaxID=2908649 RepID=UPI001F2580DD|nr:alpha/beta fold hydrolase [Rhodohalobacter sp. 614A]
MKRSKNFAQYFSMRQAILTIFHLLLIFLAVPIQGQDVSEMAGTWSGYIDVNNRDLPVNITFSYSDEILDGTIDIPDQGIFTFPVEVLDSSENKLIFQFETGNGPAIFRGIRSETNDRISGEFQQSGEVFPFDLKRNTLTNGRLSGLPESEIIIPVSEGEIGGSLALHPEESPLVLLVSGSGSNNRNQNIGGFRLFEELASELYEKGYSTFRYDDRGVGQSTGPADITLQEMGADLVQIVDYLKSNYTENISRLILLGHNQGGLVASMAAKSVSVDGLILAATPFQNGEKIIAEQIQKISEVREVSDEVLQLNLEFQEKVYNAVRTGEGWQDIEGELADRLENQIMELPLEHQNALGDMSAFIQSQVDRQLETAKTRWFKSWIETNPDEVFQDLDIPVLAVFGEKDTQILPDRNKEVADSFASATDIPFQAVIIPGANHIFQEANSGMSMEYGLLEQELINDFIQELDRFIDSL